MSEEFFIRTDDSEEARGPFTVDQLQSLADANKIDRQTLCFDEESEVWIEIGEFDKVKHQVFPEKKKLSLKMAQADQDEDEDEDDPDTSDLDDEGNELPATDVEDMLAAAEGETEGVAHLKRREERRNAAASMSLPGLGVIMLLSAFTMIYPEYQRIQEALEEETYMQLINPLIIVGGLDLIFGIFLLLAVSEIFPVVRLRAALGLGFWGYLFWAGGDPTLMWVAIGGHLSVFICTMTLNLYLMMLGLIVGVGAFGLLGYLSFSGVLTAFL